MHLQHINYCIVNKYVSIDVYYAIICMFVNIIGNTVFEPRLVLVIDPTTRQYIIQCLSGWTYVCSLF